MWATTTHWFDVAVATTIFMIGHLCFGRFVEHQSRGRRAVKSLLGIALLVGTSVWIGRPWMYGELGLILGGVAGVHGWWLPRQGVNGWTAEPRARYYALMGLDVNGKPLCAAG